MPAPVRPLPAHFDELLTVKDVAALCGITTRQVYRKARCGELPAPVKVSRRIKRWRASEIRLHLESRLPDS